jgi:hypothetical protein
LKDKSCGGRCTILYAKPCVFLIIPFLIEWILNFLFLLCIAYFYRTIMWDTIGFNSIKFSKLTYNSLILVATVP